MLHYDPVKRFWVPLAAAAVVGMLMWFSGNASFLGEIEQYRSSILQGCMNVKNKRVSEDDVNELKNELKKALELKENGLSKYVEAAENKEFVKIKRELDETPAAPRVVKGLLDKLIQKSETSKAVLEVLKAERDKYKERQKANEDALMFTPPKDFVIPENSQPVPFFNQKYGAVFTWLEEAASGKKLLLPGEAPLGFGQAGVSPDAVEDRLLKMAMSKRFYEAVLKVQSGAPKKILALSYQEQFVGKDSVPVMTVNVAGDKVFIGGILHRLQEDGAFFRLNELKIVPARGSDGILDMTIVLSIIPGKDMRMRADLPKPKAESKQPEKTTQQPTRKPETPKDFDF